MKIIKKKIIKFIKPKKKSDHRGYVSLGLENDDIIIKNSYSKKNVFRGLHVQIPPFKQTKYIWVESGEIIDFCLNLNFKLKNFGEMSYFTIRPRDGIVKILPYFAHGFFCLKPTKFNYLCVGKYNEKSEKVVKINSDVFKKIGIKNKIVISEKDMNGKNYSDIIEDFKRIKW